MTMPIPDAYVLRARVAPVVVIFIPFLLTFADYWTATTDIKVTAVVGFIGLSLITLLAQLGRDRGK